jgi:uncharacterized protein (TIGR02246 family)
MGTLQTLVALEEIRQLKARRVRCMDEKDWPGYAACHTPDAVTTTFLAGAGDAAPTVGAEAIAARLADFLKGRTTAHQIHAPEIDLTSDTTATGIWPMEDMLWWEEGGQKRWMHGYGHYRETYEKRDGRWLIKTRALTRLKLDEGAG